MSTIRPNEYDPETWDDREGEEGQFQRLRKQTGKTQTVKGGRRQQEKEWGRAINKFQKQRSRDDGKP